MSLSIPVTKMVGTGNDFLVVDARREKLARLARQWPAISRTLCDRRDGIGADGLLVLKSSPGADVKMRVFNADGSEAQMCGNGARCVAWYVAGGRSRRVTIHTKAGRLQAAVKPNRVALTMTQPTDFELHQSVTVNGRPVPFSVVNTGVPHIVVSVKSVESVDVESLGRALRYHARFSPDGTNVNFMQPNHRRAGDILVRTYERGVEGETLACGTGVTASALVYALSGNGSASAHRVRITPRSGEELVVSFRTVGQGARRKILDVVLEGPARRVFDTTVDWPMRGV